ncbi:Uncharacterized protein DBV15_02714, partial [Temnothorax longispinosus]
EGHQTGSTTKHDTRKVNPNPTKSNNQGIIGITTGLPRTRNPRRRIGAAYKFELSIPSSPLLLVYMCVERTKRRVACSPRSVFYSPLLPWVLCVRHPREKSPHAPEERGRVGRLRKGIAERRSPTQWHMVGWSCRVG